MGISESTTPTYAEYATSVVHEPYPAWGKDQNIPLSTEEIEDIFLDLTQKFGFQWDLMRNMDSRLRPFFHHSPYLTEAN